MLNQSKAGEAVACFNDGFNCAQAVLSTYCGEFGMDKKADLEIALAKEKIERTPLTKEQIVFWISRFKDGDIDDPAYRRSIVDIFVNSIFLYDDKLVIAFNYKDGAKTVTLAELESVTESDGETAHAVKMPDIADFSGSHLDGNPPPQFVRKV